MTRYRADLLAILADGRWHDARELTHPRHRGAALDAWIGVLRAAGHEISKEGEGSAARYRLVARPERLGNGRGRT